MTSCQGRRELLGWLLVAERDMLRFRMMRARIVFAVAMLLSLWISIRQQGFSVQPDYQVYYAAGMLVHQHGGAHLYDRPDQALDPIMRLTSPETPFARLAATRGIKPVLTYVYPPLLADLMVPLSLLPDLPTTIVWRIINTGLLLLCAWMLGSLLRFKLRGILLLFCAIFFFAPVAESIQFGQIGVVLLACWTVGIVLYARGYVEASAFLLALATSIKLTPVLAVFPMLLWGEWKWLRWYGAGLVAFLVVVLLCDGPVPLEMYFLHVLPAMAPGVANFQNKSVSSALQLANLALHGQDVHTAGQLIVDNASARARPVSPAWILLLAKILCGGAMAWVLWLIYQLGRGISMAQRTWILAACATLSISLSPVSWRHSYCMAVPLLVMVWHDAFKRSLSTLELVLAGLFSVEVGSFFLESLASHTIEGALLGLSVAAIPVFSVALVVYHLRRMESEVQLPTSA